MKKVHSLGNWTIHLSIAIAVVGSIGLFPVAADELAKSASWNIPSLEDMKGAFGLWLDEIEADSSTRTRVLEVLTTRIQSDPPGDRLVAILQAIQVVRPEIGTCLEQAETSRTGLEIPDFSQVLENENESDFVKHHVQLLYGRWLARNQLLDESLDELNQLEVPHVLAPATLLFYLAMTQHQLLQKEECVKTIERLLENEEQLPRRFSTLSRLMAVDIAPLETDSLDEISRLMKDIRRRQSLYRSGQRVRGQEEQVIKKLDHLIEDLEKQRQQMQQQSSLQSSQPMQDSQNAGGQGVGDVADKQQQEGGEWGSLPPAERAAAMAEMAKDLPPHYRAVIEEYFRKLADDDQ